jgi:adenylosuccinate synthase
MGATIIVDAFWGDSGKGKVSAYLARKMNVNLAVRAGVGTNAGASVMIDDQTTIKARQLPTAWLNETTDVAVGSGVMVDPGIFLSEVERFGLQGRAFVDYRCPIILPEHIEAERADAHLAKRVGSTCTGNGHARADFVLRRGPQARDVPELAAYVDDIAKRANRLAETGNILVQGSQGTLLSLALSDDYPFTTSDNCTVAACIDDVGLNWQRVDEAIMIVKVMPTRVGEGPLPYEMPESEITARNIEERGVVTGRLRRKASRIDWDLLEYVTMLNGPTSIVLTFCDHFDPGITSVRHRDGITASIRNLIAEVERVTNVRVSMIDSGKYLNDLIEIPA